MKLLARIIATGFGVGYFPLAPGTAGSLMGVLLYWFLPEISPLLLGGIIVLLSFLGIYSATLIENEQIARLGIEKGHDAQIIVIDEIVGVLIALLFIPKTFFYTTLAFVFFRLFDILKPPFINQSQKLPGGWGIMMDDILAGIYSNVLLQIFLFFKIGLTIP
jgi:phosphatidylglycerophosphatase A